MAQTIDFAIKYPLIRKPFYKWVFRLETAFGLSAKVPASQSRIDDKYVSMIIKTHFLRLKLFYYHGL